MTRSHRPTRGLALAVPLASLFLTLAIGCERQTTPSRYSVVLGDVVAAKTDIGEITVRVSRRGGQDVPDDTLHCTVTGDSEIYVNDRFSSIAEIAPGDHVELIGYRDPNPAIDRFIVTYASIDHPAAAADDGLTTQETQEE